MSEVIDSFSIRLPINCKGTNDEEISYWLRVGRLSIKGLEKALQYHGVSRPSKITVAMNFLWHFMEANAVFEIVGKERIGVGGNFLEYKA